MSRLIFKNSISEHFSCPVSDEEQVEPLSIIFNKHVKRKKGVPLICFEIELLGDVLNGKSSYFIGTDWIRKNDLAVHVSPKYNEGDMQIDFLKMLETCLKHPDVKLYNNDLCEIKFDQPHITINKESDFLTPLLIVQFLQLLKNIVIKGLKKSYYKVERNLSGKIKGKISLTKQIKQNFFHNKAAKTVCEFDEYGINCSENKILKCTLKFIQKYIGQFPEFSKELVSIINFCIPAFEMVDNVVNVEVMYKNHNNVFYKEYKEALQVAGLVLKRFGYNIKEVSTEVSNYTNVPPFWINMPKLFELYILGMLKDRFGSQIRFQFEGYKSQKPDFLLVNDSHKMVIDTKYRKAYLDDNYNIEDIRQISGYARDEKIRQELDINASECQKVVDCLIIYADQLNGMGQLPGDLKSMSIEDFVGFYKIGIKLPTITSQ